MRLRLKQFVSEQGIRSGLFAASLGLASLIVGPGCHSAGTYGHAVNYEPHGDEEDAAENALEYDPVMASRFPEEWHGKPVSAFGVVEGRAPGSSGSADLLLSVRSLAPRNLCDEGGEVTCRVTVSDREHARLHARVRLDGGDDVGRKAVEVGSLVRVIGQLEDTVHEQDGSAVLHASYYRHWPRGEFVTTAARSYMRR